MKLYCSAHCWIWNYCWKWVIMRSVCFPHWIQFSSLAVTTTHNHTQPTPQPTTHNQHNNQAMFSKEWLTRTTTKPQCLTSGQAGLTDRGTGGLPCTQHSCQQLVAAPRGTARSAYTQRHTSTLGTHWWLLGGGYERAATTTNNTTNLITEHDQPHY